MKDIIWNLMNNQDLLDEQLAMLIENEDAKVDEQLYAIAREKREEYYGKDVYVRGLIEFTNYCRNDCYYCGIRRSNKAVSRYRLSDDAILACCQQGYDLGYRTFVLQGGEDAFYTAEHIQKLVHEIKSRWQDCAITLSFGEQSYEDYQKWYEAGADRYLLRHETACEVHYSRIHPEAMSFANRQECLQNLKKIGYQTGAGFMVGSPSQTTKALVKDIRYLQRLKPEMVGIGPFISQKDTPFANCENGSLRLTLRLLALIRILLPSVLLPATTALGTIHPEGRELGLLAGANVVMPNLSPVQVRAKYALYDNKICTGEEAAECNACLAKKIASIGYKMVVDRGDFRNMPISVK